MNNAHNEQQSADYECNSGRNTRVFVREMISKDNLFLVTAVILFMD